jgi:excisionase family DNA binding protein
MALTLLSIEEAAERYRTSLEQLREMVTNGRITPVAVNGHVLLDDEEVRKVTGQNGSGLHFIALNKAATQYPLADDLLERLARDGIIRSKMQEDELLVAAEDIEPVAARLDKMNFEHLEGRPIELARAAEQYGFPFHSLRAWVAQGHIRKIKSNRRRPTLLNEADVAYTRVLAEVRGIRRGKALFPTSPQYSPVWLHE